MEEKKNWRDFPSALSEDPYFPILYLIYKKDILTEAELMKWIDLKPSFYSQHVILGFIDEMLNTTEV